MRNFVEPSRRKLFFVNLVKRCLVLMSWIIAVQMFVGGLACVLFTLVYVVQDSAFKSPFVVMKGIGCSLLFLFFPKVLIKNLTPFLLLKIDFFSGIPRRIEASENIDLNPKAENK